MLTVPIASALAVAVTVYCFFTTGFAAKFAVSVTSSVTSNTCGFASLTSVPSAFVQFTK